jgi:tRNA(Ile)-lysidine synthase
MPTFSHPDLLAKLRAILPPDTRGLCVAYSGGLDSTVLLYALAQLRGVLAHDVRAVHIDHQLQQKSAEWAEQCKRAAERFEVPFKCLRVLVERSQEGLEAAARKARYDAFRGELELREVLLTAHHADDQLETMLLALMRGAGVRGLRGMPSVQPFAGGWLVRPLLDFPRSNLEAWAREQQLAWIEDPTNVSTSMDRNYVRHSIAPILAARWPSAPLSAGRSAEHLGEASTLLDDLAAIDAAPALVQGCLDVARLRELSSARRRNLLRYWLRSHGVRAPSSRKLAGIEHDVLEAERDRSLKIALETCELRRHRDLLYCMPALPRTASHEALEWALPGPIHLPSGLGTLEMQRVHGHGLASAKLSSSLQISFRKGGEILKVAHNRPHRSLKKLLQDAKVLPWWRARLPFIYSGEDLVAVGDLWMNAEFLAAADEEGIVIVWQEKPQVTALR